MNTLRAYTCFVNTFNNYYYDMMSSLEKDLKRNDFKKLYIGSKQFKKNKRNNKKRGIK